MEVIFVTHLKLELEFFALSCKLSSQTWISLTETGFQSPGPLPARFALALKHVKFSNLKESASCQITFASISLSISRFCVDLRGHNGWKYEILHR